MSEDIHLAGVIGDPIGHSKSPILHGHWLKRYGINGHYIPIHVARDDFADVLKTLPKMGFRGVNVTIPHKETALQIADTITDRAALIGAANTLTFTTSGTVQADNTDGIGFLANIKQRFPDWKASNGSALVLGAGGASRAIVSALLGDGVSEVILVNRTRSRSEALRDQLGARIKVADWTKIPEVLPHVATVVNTTSLGMVGQPALNIDLTGLNKDTVVNDLVYAPLMTDFLLQAEQAGANIVDGLGMLLHQAAPGFERWFGQRPDVDNDLRKAVLSA